MSIELTVQLIAYAVLITAVIVTMRADAKRNREVVLEMKKYLDSHAETERADMRRLDGKVEQNARENGVAHSEILKELGRLGGKIDNGGKGWN